jgi:hypothetical protein
MTRRICVNGSKKLLRLNIVCYRYQYFTTSFVFTVLIVFFAVLGAFSIFISVFSSFTKHKSTPHLCCYKLRLPPNNPSPLLLQASHTPDLLPLNYATVSNTALTNLWPSDKPENDRILNSTFY